MPEARASRSSAERGAPSRANLAAGLAAAAVVVWLALMAADADGPIWILQGALALAAAIAGWRAGNGAMPHGRALVALVVGGLLFLMFVGFTIAEA